MAKVSKLFVKPYLRKNDHPFVSLATFINYVRNNKNWWYIVNDLKVTRLDNGQEIQVNNGDYRRSQFVVLVL